MNTIVEQLKWKSINQILDEKIKERDSIFQDCKENRFGNYITIRVKVRHFPSGFCAPDTEGDCEEYAIFRRMTLEDSIEFDALAIKKQKVGERNGEDVFEKVVDFNEYHRLLLMKNLVDWSLDTPIEKGMDGWLTDRCWEHVSKICAPLLDAFVRKFDESNIITAEEEETINKQSLVLFGKNSKGVQDACEAVTKFCTYGNFSEKFNLDIDGIKNIPYREYLLLRMMISNENDSIKLAMRSKAQNTSSTKIATGGRAMPSRGTVRPMPGSMGY